MNGQQHLLFSVVLIFISCTFSIAEEGEETSGILLADSLQNSADSLSKKQTKKIERKEWRQQAHQNNQKYFIQTLLMYATLKTDVTFNRPGGIISATIGLEEHLKLPDHKNMLFCSFLGRITPNSGIFAQYYGLNRTQTKTFNQDLIFFEDTIPAGTTSQIYFNTQMFSFGYILSLLKKPDVFLGVYFNIIVMYLDLGVQSDIGNIDAADDPLLPFPNFGLVAHFKLKDWLLLNGSVGFFGFRVNAMNESLYDLILGLEFKPKTWFGISIGYQEFDVKALFPQENIDVEVNYNFRGPAIGLNFSF